MSRGCDCALNLPLVSAAQTTGARAPTPPTMDRSGCLATSLRGAGSDLPQVWTEDLVADAGSRDAAAEECGPDVTHEGQRTAREHLDVVAE